MDVLANKILAASMCAPGKMDYVASEEEEKPTYCSVVLQNAAFRYATPHAHASDWFSVCGCI